MASLNKVMIIGRLGSDPEMRYTPSGTAVTTFTVACNSKSGKGEEAKDETEWFNVVVWNKQAENCNQFITKGSEVYVEGRQHTRSWDDKEGQKHYKVELIANQVLFLSKKANVEPDQGDIPF